MPLPVCNATLRANVMRPLCSACIIARAPRRSRAEEEKPQSDNRTGKAGWPLAGGRPQGSQALPLDRLRARRAAGLARSPSASGSGTAGAAGWWWVPSCSPARSARCFAQKLPDDPIIPRSHQSPHQPPRRRRRHVRVRVRPDRVAITMDNPQKQRPFLTFLCSNRR